ncbi:MFS transporter [Thalassobaculum fulvum]|uniref:Lysosomal dipeptide transporter MFSD1 n=1 Tax=Thalassobaculum fulvum TaxID=1633335 RepID=A0A918XX11_9PROT|nr:MFS transporter [Thalassobaculum fulvum]GHD61520.1 MFS transporter [Thalassobaculum fulvum]
MIQAIDTPSAPAVPRAALLGFGWLLCALFFLYAFVQRVAPSVMVDDLMRDFAVGGALLGNLSAYYYYAYAGSQIPVGVLMDRFGPRRLVTIAAALAGAGSLVFVMADGLWLASVGRLMIGFGCAFSFVGALNYAALWFPPNRFATLSGWAQMLGVAGGILGQAPLGYLVESVGWRLAVAGLAAFGLALAVATGLVLRDRPRSAPAASAGGLRLLSGLKRAAATGQVWLAAGFGMAMTGSMLAFGGLWGVPYVEQAYDLPKAEAAALVSILFVGWGVGAPLWGVLSDRWSRRRPFMAIGGVLATAGIAGAVYLPGLDTVSLAAILCIQGFGSSSMVLCFAVARENTPAWSAGVTLGIVNGFVVGSGAVLQPLVGWLLDLGWEGSLVAGARIYSLAAYQGAFLILPVTCAWGVLITLFVRETGARPFEE